MSRSQDSIIAKLQQFGLEDPQVRIYLHLLKDSPLSILELSRSLKLGRNVVYRLIEGLEDLGLVHKIKGSAGNKIKAEPYQELENLLALREQQVIQLKSELPEIFGHLAELSSQFEESKIKYYKDTDGLKQITLNSLKANKELLILEMADMSSFLDFGYAEKVRREFVRNKVLVKEITNLKEMEGWTEVHDFVENFWDCRYISPVELKTDFELLIYNNTVALYTFREKKIWGLEIESPALASMQKQIFNFIWAKARPMRIIDLSGAAVV